MLLWALIILGGAILVLASVNGWAWVRAKANKVVRETEDAAKDAWEWSTRESRIDEHMMKAEKNWQYAVKVDLFWIGVVFLAGMISLDVLFGYSRGGGSGLTFVGLVTILLLVAADLAIPVLAINGDKSDGNWWDAKTSRRSAANWVLLFFCTCLSLFIVIGSTAETSNITAAANQTAVIDREELVGNIARWTDERNNIQVDRGAEALNKLAETEEELAKRESGRGGCGVKCDTHTKAASEYRARAAQAARKDELTVKIAKAREALKGEGNARVMVDPLAEAAEAVGGNGETVTRWALTWIGLALVVVNTGIWLSIADRVTLLRNAELALRASVADKKRKEIGLPPKYTKPEEPLTAIEDKSGGDTIVVNSVPVDLTKRFVNDANLEAANRALETHAAPSADATLLLGDLHRAYKIATLKADPIATYMTYQTFVEKMDTIAHFRDDVALSADGEIVGWTLAENLRMEAAE